MFDNCNVLSLNKPTLSLLQNIVHFGSPIDSNSQDFTKFKLHNSSHITQYISHITYDFEVRQNIKDNNDCTV